jgi:hypothetical protein
VETSKQSTKRDSTLDQIAHTSTKRTDVPALRLDSELRAVVPEMPCLNAANQALFQLLVYQRS